MCNDGDALQLLVISSPAWMLSGSFICSEENRPST